MSLQDFHTRLELIFKTKTQPIVPEQLMDNIKHYLTIASIVYNGFTGMLNFLNWTSLYKNSP